MSNEILIVDLSKLKNVSSLCRVCLTESPDMESLYSPLELPYKDNMKTLMDILQHFCKKPLPTTLEYPSLVCPVCLDLLSTAYKLHIQLKVSNRQLSSYFKSDIVVPEKTEEVAPVEIISSHGKHSLKDLVVVEDVKVENKPSFEGFLNNLGSEISANFIAGNHSNKPRMPETHVVSMIPLNKLKSEAPTGTDICENVDVNQNKTKENKTEEEESVCSKKSKKKYEPVKCNLCDKVFAFKRNLNRHKSEMHREKNYLCQMCGHMARTPSSLHNHFLLKHAEKRHECDICKKKYFMMSQLRAHKIVHKNERLYLCTVCGKNFNYYSALIYHMRTHTGEKNYKCTYCTRGFSMKCALNRHLRSHTGSRPYSCNFCDKAFRSKGEVNCHEMTHTGYRPYWCKYCKKGFTKTYNLKMHMLGHKGPHYCEFCKRGFIEMQYLKLHMKSIHGMLDAVKEEFNYKDEDNLSALSEAIFCK